IFKPRWALPRMSWYESSSGIIGMGKNSQVGQNANLPARRWQRISHTPSNDLELPAAARSMNTRHEIQAQHSNAFNDLTILTI
ncbi:MAG: hypothetical protein WCD79_10880, partial [Chthoniobacteraceae bacterium]